MTMDQTPIPPIPEAPEMPAAPDAGIPAAADPTPPIPPVSAPADLSVNPLQPIFREFEKPQWSNPIWWSALITSVIAEVIALGTVFRWGHIVQFLSGVDRSSIVIAAQFFAMLAPLVAGWLHHKAHVAAKQAEMASLQSYNTAVAQIHYNEATVRMHQMAYPVSGSLSQIGEGQ